jgi:hypothetical protein
MHPLRRFKLSRRHALRGLLGGAAVAVPLPLLEAMVNSSATALAGGEPLPRRFISFFWGNGVPLAEFEPTSTGADYLLPPMLDAFAPVKDYVTLCTGLLNRFPPEDAITHHEGMTGLSGYPFVLRPELPGFASDWGGPTIDQVIADAVVAQVPGIRRSIEIQISKFMSPADNGTTAETISVRGEPGNLVPLPPEFDPSKVWNTLFGEFSGGADDRDLRLSILDLVKADADRLRPRLGKDDNQRIDAHFQGILELEQSINALVPACVLDRAETEDNSEPNGQENLSNVTTIMSRLIAKAFECDVTRVASVLFLALAGESVLSQAGPSTSTHHNNSHSGGQAYTNGVHFIMEQFSELMQVLQSVQEIDGTTLLDSTILYGTSDCSVGYTHAIGRQPIILGGRGRDYLVHPGIHYQAVASGNPNSATPSVGNMSDVLLSCLQAFDPAATEIGADEPYSNTPLTEILA